MTRAMMTPAGSVCPTLILKDRRGTCCGLIPARHALMTQAYLPVRFDGGLPGGQR